VKKILLFIIVFLSVLAAISYVKARNTTPPQGTHGPSCDMSLWAHVYDGCFLSAEDRLEIHGAPCNVANNRARMVMKAGALTGGEVNLLDFDPFSGFDRIEKSGEKWFSDDSLSFGCKVHAIAFARKSRCMSPHWMRGEVGA
jgi:hypothetical protein